MHIYVTESWKLFKFDGTQTKCNNAAAILIVLFETLNFECARTMKNVSRQRVSRLSADIFDLTTPCLVVFIHFSLLCKNSVFQNKTAIETDKRS